MTCNGIFGLGRAKNGTSGHFSRGIDPHSSFFALKPHGNARVIRVLLFSAQKRPLLIASHSWERFTKRRNDGQQRKARLYSAARNSFFSAYETYCGLLQAFVVGMAQKDVIRKNSKISLLNYFSSPFDFGPHFTI